jgi:hypothetical protein
MTKQFLFGGLFHSGFAGGSRNWLNPVLPTRQNRHVERRIATFAAEKNISVSPMMTQARAIQVSGHAL